MAPYPDSGMQPVEQPGFFTRLWNALKAFFGFVPKADDGMMPGGDFPIDSDGGGGTGEFIEPGFGG